MTGLDRVLATAAGSPRDRGALSLTLSAYGARMISCPLKDYYHRPELYLEGQEAIRSEFQPDILFSPFALAVEGEAFGARLRYFESAAPNLAQSAFASVKELVDFDFSTAIDHPRIRYIHDATRALASLPGQDRAICGIFLSPLDLPAIILGLDAWLDAFLFKEAEWEAVCDKTTEYFVQRANAFFDDGAQILALPMVFCSPSILTKQLFEKRVLPRLKDAFARVKGPLVIHHGGAPISAHLAALAGIPQALGCVVDPMDSLGGARSLIGKEKLLLGNFDGPKLNGLSPEQAYTRVMAILQNRAEDRHFILASSSADIQSNTDPQSLKAIHQALIDFGPVS